MKRVLLIGKFNDIFQSLNDELTKKYMVQVSIDNLKIIQDMLKLNTPDVIVMSLHGMECDVKELYEAFGKLVNKVPVICVGTATEHAEFAQYYEQMQFYSITYPHERYAVTKCIEHISRANGRGSDGDDAPRKRVVLLIDDNPTQLRAINSILCDHYEVHMATSGVRALTMIVNEIPDIIFLDYEMPHYNGVQTMQMIRELPNAKDVPIVFLTGMKDKEHFESVLEFRPDGYLLKPVSKKRILEMIDAVLK